MKNRHSSLTKSQKSEQPLLQRLRPKLFSFINFQNFRKFPDLASLSRFALSEIWSPYESCFHFLNKNVKWKNLVSGENPSIIKWVKLINILNVKFSRSILVSYVYQFIYIYVPHMLNNIDSCGENYIYFRMLYVTSTKMARVTFIPFAVGNSRMLPDLEMEENCR